MYRIIKQLRELHNYSQTYISQYLNVSRQMYIKYETGVVEPPVKVVKALCELYQVSYETILGQIEKKDTYKKQTKTEMIVAESTPSYGMHSSFLFEKAVEMLKQLSDIQISAVLGIMKVFCNDIDLPKTTKKSCVDYAEVEKINAVYDKIPKEQQLLSAKAGSKTVCEALKNDTW